MKMKIIQFSVLFLMFLLVSCKKERTCECKNATATYDAGTLDATRSYAKKYCSDMSNGETTCSLKE